LTGDRTVAVAAFVCALALLCGCAPWTVVPIQDSDSTGGSGQAHNSPSPAAYVDAIWDSKLLPALRSAATDARTLLDAIAASPDEAGRRFGRRESGGSWYFAVQGKGRVLAVDTSSRNGLLQLDIAPFDGRADVSLQIGPVLRGSALRDATGVVRFTDFANQLAFADVQNEINGRVLKTVLSSLDPRALVGRMVEFMGAFGLDGTGVPPIRGVAPVLLKVETQP